MKICVFYTFFALIVSENLIESKKVKSSALRILQTGGKDYQDLVESVRQGAKMGLSECKNQFINEKWNCSISFRNKRLTDMPIFVQSSIPAANRETAFVHSISAAGVTYRLTEDCRRGKFENCDCVQSKKSKKDWGGCNDNVKFGDLLARHFLDALEKDKKARSAMNLHNNFVGRKAVKATLKKQCKCHGLSGGCSTKTCWKQLAPFIEVGKYLKEKYLKAKAVLIKDSKLMQKISPQSYSLVPKKDRSLVYIESSPDYCRFNAVTGSMGVLGRECFSDDASYSKCNNICTSCGFQLKKKLIVRSVKCDCKFVWCCRVQCNTCVKLAAKTTCHS